VDPPIATCEEQGFVYASKLQFAEVLWWMDRKEDAKRLYREAQELKKRFNEVFWMEEEGFFALGLDSKGRQIRAISSDPGHCIATGIADEALVLRVADRLLSDDMFTGWAFARYRQRILLLIPTATIVDQFGQLSTAPSPWGSCVLDCGTTYTGSVELFLKPRVSSISIVSPRCLADIPAMTRILFRLSILERIGHKPGHRRPCSRSCRACWGYIPTLR